MPRYRQRGFVLLLVMLIGIVAGVTLFVTARAPGDAARAGQGSRSAAVLAGARDAVIAYAGFGGTNAVKGALPCPDFADPGDSGAGTSGPECINGSASVYLARLPWRTIDVDARAGSLWYAIDADYRDEQSEVEPLNPSTPGSLQVDGEGGYVAVIIDPGDPLAGQTGRPGTSVADYLEDDNADGDESFVDCTDVAGCNDRVAGIRVDALWDPVQRRVLGEVEDALEEYYAANGHLPYAADFGTIECELNNHLGQLPLAEGTCGGTYEVFDEDDFPDWMKSATHPNGGNDWLELVVYHVDTECATGNCAAATMTLDDTGGLQAVVAAAGRALGSQMRPGGGVGDYLDDPENIDGDADYVERPLGPGDNDVLRGIEVPPP